jgi:hypothetical protein
MIAVFSFHRAASTLDFLEVVTILEPDACYRFA